MTRKAVIGISCSWMIDSGGAFAGYRRAYVNHDYVRSVEEAGGVPLLLPFVEALEEKDLLEAYLERIDGLLLSGGHDVEPEQYGEEPQQRLGDTWSARDRFDIALFRGALKKELPVFGICRGFQIMNVALGGSLLQDLSYSDTPLLKHVQGHSYSEGTHWVKLAEGSIFYELFGEKLYVNSWHHQTVKEAGKGLTVCARSSDGVIEAVADPERRMMGTQWHPEMMSAVSEEMKRLFRHFVEECANAAKR